MAGYAGTVAAEVDDLGASSKHCHGVTRHGVSLLWLWTLLSRGLLHQPHPAAACSAQTPRSVSHLHMCCCRVLSVCVWNALGECWASMSVCGSYCLLKEGSSFDITIPCKSSIRHLGFLCSRQAQPWTPQCQRQHRCSGSHVHTLTCAGSLRIASEDKETQV